MRNSKVLTVLVALVLVAGIAVAQPSARDNIDWTSVKQMWHALTPAEQDAYQQILADRPSVGGPGTVTALGRALSPVAELAPADTCGAATEEIGPLPYSDAGDNSGLTDDYDLVASATCNTGFDSNGPEIVYNVMVDQTCDVTVTETLGTYDVVVWAVTDCSDTDNTCVGSDDTGNPETFTFTASAGTNYFVMVDGWNGQGGAYNLDLTEATSTGCSLVPVELQGFEIE